MCVAAEAVSSSGYRSPGALGGGGAVISLDSPSPPAPGSPPALPHVSITPVPPRAERAEPLLPGQYRPGSVGHS